uniref:Alpha-defensin N-terminal domain-containing protein n=1 Tax=Spermophilus dauricus TaxID=99837 RepID=A0A8C9PL81_SPEDA
MRTLALLAALLLLALQAQAEPLPENKEEAPEQEQPGEEDQDMAISFESDHHSIPLALSVSPGARGIRKCRCTSGVCDRRRGESNHGSCFQGPRVYTFCCRPI